MNVNILYVELDYKLDSIAYMSADAKISGKAPLGDAICQSLRRVTHDVEQKNRVRILKYTKINETTTTMTYAAKYITLSDTPKA